MTKKEELIEKATELFSKRGFDSVGVQEIVKKCEVTKPTLYHYFKSKAGLIEAVSLHKFAPFIEKLKILCEYKGDLTNNINEIISFYFSFAKENASVSKLMLSSEVLPFENEVGDIINPYLNKQFEYIQTMFYEASKDHGNMIGRDYRYAASFLGTINTYLALYFREKVNLDNEIVYQISQQFMHGIFS